MLGFETAKKATIDSGKNMPAMMRLNHGIDGSNTTTSKSVIRSRPFTNVNSDDVCLPSNHSLWRHWVYTLDLWNGLYMLTPNERFVLRISWWFCVLGCLLYGCVFWLGVYHGVCGAMKIAPEGLPEPSVLHQVTDDVHENIIVQDSFPHDSL